jgi:tetratricopeptide (TPR) repeat protein
MYNLGQVYYDQKRFDDAEAPLKQILQSQLEDSQFGSEDNDTLFTMNMLANVYISQKRYDEARSLLTRVLQVQENLLG